MQLISDRRAQSIQIGAVLLFGILIIMLAIWQAFVVPNQNEEIEFDHNQDLQQEMTELRGTVNSMSDATSVRSTSVGLGVRYPSRAIFVNPGPVSGTLRTIGTTDDSVAVEFANLTVQGSVGDFWNETASYNTGSIAYGPSYNLYSNAPETVYENSLLYNDFAGGSDEENALPLTSQSLVDDDRITVVALNGTFSDSRTGSTAVDFRPVSTATRTIQVSDADTDGNLTVAIPTRLSAETWTEILEDQAEFTDQDGHVVAVRDGPNDTVEIEFEADETYNLRMAKVGVGTQVTEENAAYITDIDGDGATRRDDETHEVTAEVRDAYNGPVPDVAVTGSADDGTLTETTRRTDSDGQATFVYDPDDVSSGERTDQIDFTIRKGASPGADFDPNEPENLTMEVTVRATTTGEGVDPEYEVFWDQPFDEPFTSDGCEVDTCIEVDSAGEMTFDTDPETVAGFAEFAVEDRNIGTLNIYSKQFEDEPDRQVEFAGESPGETDVTVFAGGSRDTVTVEVILVPVTVETNPATDVGQTQATLNGDLVDVGGADDADVFFEYRETGETTWIETNRETLTDPGTFAETVTGLSPNTEYEFRAVGESEAGTDTGNTLSFTTSPPGQMSTTDGATINPDGSQVVFYLINDGPDTTIEEVTIDGVTGANPDLIRRTGGISLSIDRGDSGVIDQQNWDIGDTEAVEDPSTIPSDGVARIQTGNFRSGPQTNVDMDGATIDLTIEYGNGDTESLSVDVTGEYQGSETGGNMVTNGETAIVEANVGGSVITGGGDVILEDSNVGGNIDNEGSNVIIRDGSLGGVFPDPPGTLRLIGNWNLNSYDDPEDTGADEIIIVP